MDKQTKKVFLEQARLQYRKANKSEKSKLLDSYALLLHTHRKSLIRMLAYEPRPRKAYPQRETKFTPAVKAIIKEVYELSGSICAERIYPSWQLYLAVVLAGKRLSKHEEEVVVRISLISLKRIIATFPKLTHPHTTSSLHKGIYQKVPIKVDFGEYDEPGKIEVDFVEHCGSSATGRYICTLTLTDVWSGWTVNAACMGKDRQALKQAFHQARKRMYHKVSEYHPDNNPALVQMLLALSGEYAVSRSRPYKKNDNAHVEQKNKDRVRKWVGYYRYDTAIQLELLNQLYEILDPYQNFFTPSMKLLKKERRAGKVIKKYHDTAQTPYQRLLNSPLISPHVKTILTNRYSSFSLLSLKHSIDLLLKHLSNTIS